LSKKNNLYNILIGIVLFGVLIQSGNSYTEVYDNAFVDGSLDDFYEIEYNQTNSKIYFAKSISRNAFFIIADVNISVIQINNSIISSNTSSNNIASAIFENNAEIIISKSVLDNCMFDIIINNLTSIVINPFDIVFAPPINNTSSTSTASSTNTTTNTNSTPSNSSNSDVSDETPVLNFVPTLYFLYDALPFFILCFSLILIFFADYKNHPEIKCSDIHGKSISLGRFLYDFDDKISGLRCWVILTKKGVKKFYCRFPFRGLDFLHYDTFYAIKWIYPDVISTDLDIPSEFQGKIFHDEPISSKKNSFLKFLFGFLSRTPFRGPARWIWNKIESVKTPLKKLPFILPEIMLSDVEFRFKMEYREDSLDLETNEHVIKDVVKENLVHNEIELIRRNIPDNLKEFIKIYLTEVLKVDYNTLEEALKVRKSKAEIRNNYEYRTLKLEHEFYIMENRFENASQQMQHLKIAFKERLRNQRKPLEEISENFDETFAQLLKKSMSGRVLLDDENLAITIAIKKHIDENDSEKMDLIKQVATLEAKLDVLSNYKPNSSKHKKLLGNLNNNGVKNDEEE
jgi:hypothetical protein